VLNHGRTREKTCKNYFVRLIRSMLLDIDIHSQLIPPHAQDVRNSASSIQTVEKPVIDQTKGKINHVPTSQVFQHRTKLKTLAETASQEQEVQSQHYQRATHKN